MDRFDGMRAFVRVVESGSFTKAADNLGWSRTTVTQLVQQLEARLQVKLLHRTTRQVNASPLANIILVPALPAFHSRFPDIQLDMGASDRKVDLIGDNVDCVVRGGEIKDQGLVARHVGDLQLGVYAAPSYLAQAGTPLHPDELRDPSHRIVRYRWDGDLPYAMRKGRETAKVGGRYVLAIDDGNAYLTAGLSGLGALWLPHYMAGKHVASGALVPLFTDWHVDAMPLYLAYPPNRYVSRQLRVFIDWIVELMAVHAPRGR